jgi:hypothetical protein
MTLLCRFYCFLQSRHSVGVGGFDSALRQAQGKLINHRVGPDYFISTILTLLWSLLEIGFLFATIRSLLRSLLEIG